MQPFQRQPPFSILSDQHTATDAALRRSARVAAKTVEQRPVQDEDRRVSSDPVISYHIPLPPDLSEEDEERLGEPLARQPLPVPVELVRIPVSAPLRGPERGPDYGRSGTTVKMPLSFQQREFNDLEPGTTLENKPPADVLPSESSMHALSRVVDKARATQIAVG